MQRCTVGYGSAKERTLSMQLSPDVARAYALYGTLYFYALALMRVDALLERRYALWKRGGEAA